MVGEESEICSEANLGGQGMQFRDILYMKPYEDSFGKRQAHMNIKNRVRGDTREIMWTSCVSTRPILYSVKDV